MIDMPTLVLFSFYDAVVRSCLLRARICGQGILETNYRENHPEKFIKNTVNYFVGKRKQCCRAHFGDKNVIIFAVDYRL